MQKMNHPSKVAMEDGTNIRKEKILLFYSKQLIYLHKYMELQNIYRGDVHKILPFVVEINTTIA
jgi:hypothetical protein